MHYINEIKRLAKDKKIPLAQLAINAGLSVTGFHQAIKNNSLRLRDFIKICEILGVSPAELLQEAGHPGVVNEPKALYRLTDRELLERTYKKVTEIEKDIKKRGI